MGLLYVLLFIIVQFHIVKGQNCDGFKLYDGDTEVTNVNCTVDGPDCDQINLSNLTAGDAVGKPQGFYAEESRQMFPYGGDNLTVSYMTFTWKPPLEEISRRHLTGFYMRRLQLGSAVRTCTAIDLRNVDLTTSVNFRFTFKLGPIFNGKNQNSFVAYLTSLPPPSDAEFEGGLVERIFYTVQPGINHSVTPVQYPSDWTTWIIMKLHQDTGIVQMEFGYPIPGSLANFTSFQLQIVNQNNPSQPFKKFDITRQGSEPVGKHNFTDIPTGSYKVQLMPDDPFFNDDNTCLCWKMTHPPFSTKTCNPCTFTATGFFNFTSLVTPTTTTTTPTTTTTTPNTTTNSTTNVGASTGLTAGEITMATLLPLVAVVLLAVVVLLCLHRKGKLSFSRSGSKGDVNRNFPNNGKGNWMPRTLTITGQQKDPPVLTRKTILLLAADDHTHFTQAVDKMAAFLQLHCQCDVTLAPKQTMLSHQIDTADFVVMVVSEAAYHLYKAYLTGQVYRDGGVTMPGLQHICGRIASSQDVSKVVMVRLPHTPPSFRLPLPVHPSLYCLPTHLPSFLKLLHGLDDNTMDLSKVNLPLQGNVSQLEGGGQWLDAVHQADQYEQQQPCWFLHSFGRPSPQDLKPDYLPQVSNTDSGFNEGRNHHSRLSSTSTVSQGDNYTDLGVDNCSFTKDQFYAPSVCMTAYTVDFPGDNPPAEIDHNSISQEFRRLNHQYELDQGLQSGHSDGPLFNGLPYDPNTLYDPSLILGQDSMGGQPREQDCISVSSAQSV